MNTTLHSLYLFRKRHKLQFFFHDQLFQHISVRSRPGFDWTVERRTRLGVILKNTKHISFNKPFSSCPKPLLQSKAKCEVVKMKLIFIIMEIELIFRKRFALSPVLKVRVCGEWPMHYSVIIIRTLSCSLELQPVAKALETLYRILA